MLSVNSHSNIRQKIKSDKQESNYRKKVATFEIVSTCKRVFGKSLVQTTKRAMLLHAAVVARVTTLLRSIHTGITKKLSLKKQTYVPRFDPHNTRKQETL
jgi:hypothetical protein